jgi:hypothetical protein
LIAKFILEVKMKRVFLLALICVLALIGVSANEGAGFEPVLFQVSLELPLDNTELIEVQAFPSAVFLYHSYLCSVYQEIMIGKIDVLFINPSGTGYGGSQTNGNISRVNTKFTAPV